MSEVYTIELDSNDYLREELDSIKDQVSIFEVWDHFQLERMSENVTQQVYCPFHEDDRDGGSKSARIFEDGAFHCYRCEAPFKHMDVISLVRYLAELKSIKETVEYIKKNFVVEIKYDIVSKKEEGDIPAWKIFKDIEDYFINRELKYERAMKIFMALDGWFEYNAGIDFIKEDREKIVEEFKKLLT